MRTQSDSEGATASPEQAGTADRAAERQRLLRAEADLEGAIAECACALKEVRRELRRHATRTPPIVH